MTDHRAWGRPARTLTLTLTPNPNQVCEQGVEEACDALTREEDARAKWLALRAEAKRRRALGLPATTRGIWGF